MNATPRIAPRKCATLAGSCRMALEASLDPILREGRAADRVLARFYREHRNLGSRDRLAISQTLFSFFRYYGWLRRVYGDRPEQRSGLLSRMLLDVFAADGVRPLPTGFWCAENNYAEEKFDEILTQPDAMARFAASSGVCAEELSLGQLLPDWAEAELSEETRSLYLPYLTRRSPLWVRVREESVVETVRAAFSEQGWPTSIPAHCPTTLRLSGERVQFSQLPASVRGLFEVQDYASQCIGRAGCAAPGETWWDACAGGGGKTLQLAGAVGSCGGCVIASDVREHLYEEIRARAERAGVARAIRTESFSLAAERQYDGVLVDAPCSSSGRWRRNPEMRWSEANSSLDRLVSLQMEILEKASASVRPGGVLVYATCSVFPRENQQQTDAFLKRHPDFELDGFPDPLCGGMTRGMLPILPGDVDSDGAFVARMVRKTTG